MIDHNIEGLSFGLYAELIMNLVDGAICLSLRDAHGTVMWHHDRDGRPPIKFSTWFPPAANGWQELDDGVLVRRAGDHLRLYARAIHAGTAGGPFYFCLLHEWSVAPVDCMIPNVAQKAVAGMSALIGNHYELNHELNTMSDELIRRYEELNLVYDTDDEVRCFSEGELALHQIVENCTEYLNVDITALYLTSNDRVMVRTRHSRMDAGETELVKDLRAKVLEWMLANNTSVVPEKPADRKAVGLGSDNRYGMIASPIRDIKGRVLGSLVVLNRPDNRDFENGDRNLLKVMADKASKIIRVNYDPLTGLMSREGFERTIAKVLPEAVPQHRSVCLLHANVDQLQLVNDTFGHDAGDNLLLRVAKVLKNQLRGNDRIARLGGDEFGILLYDCGVDDAKRMAERVCVKVSALECAVGHQRLDVGVSVGVAPIDHDLDSVINVMAAADLACTAAKEQGRNRAYIYHQDDEEMQERKQQMHWVGTLQRAIKLDHFELFSQIIEPTEKFRASPHFEILLRMVGGDGELVSPGLFMPVAERYHMMPAIDRWVIEHGLELLAQWWSEGTTSSAVYAINLSGQTLTDQRTLDFLIAQLQASAVNPENICFEITETEAITNLVNAQHFIASVRALGCRFALDDFGAGVTSFTNLRALDVDYLKIDGSFVVDMANDPVSHAMVAAINQVGQTMKLDTVAEFVESAEIRSLLADLGVDYLQGYDIGRPRPLIEQLREMSGIDARSA